LLFFFVFILVKLSFQIGKVFFQDPNALKIIMD